MDSMKILDKDTRTVDGHWRTGMVVNDARIQPKAKRSGLTDEDYESLPKFTSSPVMTVPLPVANRSGMPSPNTIPVPRRKFDYENARWEDDPMISDVN